MGERETGSSFELRSTSWSADNEESKSSVIYLGVTQIKEWMWAYYNIDVPQSFNLSLADQLIDTYFIFRIAHNRARFPQGREVGIRTNKLYIFMCAARVSQGLSNESNLLYTHILFRVKSVYQR